MKTLVLSTVCGLALFAVSTAQAGHPIARARVANHYQAKVGIRQTKAATRYNAAESYRAKVATRKANADAVRSSRVEALENFQTNTASLADQIRGARFALSVIGDIKGERPLEWDGVDGEQPLPIFWWLY